MVTPFEVGYVPPPQSASDPFFVVNRAIDVIFIFDMAIQFVLMTEVDTLDKQGHDSEYNMNLCKLTCDYLTGWFIIDIISVGTCLFDILPIAGVGGNVGGVKALRTVRALRLVKLLRLVKSSKVLQRLAARITLSSFWSTIISLGIKFFVVVHYYACIVAISTTFYTSPLDTWMATHGFCQPNPSFDPEAATGGGNELFECVSPGYLYRVAVRWAMGLIAGAGFSIMPSTGPFPAHYSDDNEYEAKFRVGEDVLLLILKTIGLLLWALIFSTLIRTVNQADPEMVIYMHIHTHVHIHIYIHTYAYACTYTYTYTGRPGAGHLQP